MSKLLQISYYFPPIQSSAVVRNGNIAHQFSKKVEKVFVISTRNYKIFKQDPRAFDASMDIFYAPTFDYRTITSLFRKNDKKEIHFTERTKSSIFARFFIKFINTFPINIIIGEGGAVYILCALIRSILLMRKHKIEYVFSSFRPFSDHFIAWALTLIFPKLKWIADYRDIQIEQQYKLYFFANYHHFLNKFFLKRATIVTTVSKGLVTDLEQYQRPIYLLNNGIEFDNQHVDQFSDKEKFIFSYTGSMFLGERDCHPFLQNIKSMIDVGMLDQQKVEIHYAGKDGDMWLIEMTKLGIEKLFINHGMLSAQEVRKLQRTSNFNILLTISTPELKGVITGKFQEYLAARVPIICHIKGDKDDEILSIFDQAKCGVVFYEASDQNFQHYVKNVYDKFIHYKSKETIDLNNQFIKTNYDWKTIMYGLFEQLK
ncbi:MAG: hypothetical protein KBA06_05030 [Saprospiraceae bacterium]|nr:hypothetical protein [Saprospiraceae bacterium]